LKEANLSKSKNARYYKDCFVCRKHAGKEDAPPGGYIYESRNFLLCHSQLKIAPLGTLIVESKRHFLDFSEMTSKEGAELNAILRSLFPLMKRFANAERIYSLAMMDGAPHFHLWLVPRVQGSRIKGTRYLAREHWKSSEREALQYVRKIKRYLGKGQPIE
jgi:diadenosine tetraphosphate (Ap4A) HIT family hydrolase